MRCQLMAALDFTFVYCAWKCESVDCAHDYLAYYNILIFSPCYIRCFARLSLKMSSHPGMSKKISQENWTFLSKRYGVLDWINLGSFLLQVTCMIYSSGDSFLLFNHPFGPQQ
jgi:hypothetical protein